MLLRTRPVSQSRHIKLWSAVFQPGRGARIKSSKIFAHGSFVTTASGAGGGVCSHRLLAQRAEGQRVEMRNDACKSVLLSLFKVLWGSSSMRMISTSMPNHTKVVEDVLFDGIPSQTFGGRKAGHG